MAELSIEQEDYLKCDKDTAGASSLGIRGISNLRQSNNINSKKVSFSHVDIKYIKPKKVIPWYYRLFICGITDN